MADEYEYGLPAQARQRQDHIALRLGDESLTYAELDERARRASHAVHALGVKRGDAVSVMVPNRFEFFEAVHACGRLGAVAVPVNVHFKADEAGWIVSDSGSTAVVVSHELEDALTGVPDVPRLVVDAEPGDDRSYEAALAAAPEVGEVDPPGEMGDAWFTTMAYSSGTTGRPKGIAMAEADFRRTAEGFAAMGTRWEFGPDDVHLLVGPSYHSGPAAWAQMHLAFGGTVVILPKWDSEECLRLIDRWKTTNTHMVPANFSRLLDLPEETRNRYDLSSMKMFVHAAAPCPVPLKRAFMELVGSDKVWEYYGASEGGGTVIPPDEWLAHPGSVGRPFPGNEFAILDDDGNPVPTGVSGTIYAHPGASGFSYHNDDEKTKAAYRGDWFTVGDAGYLDEEGYLYLTDRKADMVISGGVNIYPREIEECLFRNTEVVDCGVLGVPDEKWGEILLAVVQRAEGSTLDADGVIEWCREHLADYKRPRIVEFIDELPRDPSGKFRKPKFRTAWVATREAAPA